MLFQITIIFTLVVNILAISKNDSSVIIKGRESPDDDPLPWHIQENLYLPIVCETSSKSPLLSDLQMAVHQLRKKFSSSCKHKPSPHGKGCSTIVRHNIASVGLCGGIFETHLRCPELAEHALDIGRTCVDQHGKTGGLQIANNPKVLKNSEFRVIVF